MLYQFTKVSSHFCELKPQPCNTKTQNGYAILCFGITATLKPKSNKFESAAKQHFQIYLVGSFARKLL
jgi:hypothetical protein